MGVSGESVRLFGFAVKPYRLASHNLGQGGRLSTCLTPVRILDWLIPTLLRHITAKRQHPAAALGQLQKVGPPLHHPGACL
jgi:hypothetical protein